jgi:hypothetical protein
MTKDERGGLGSEVRRVHGYCLESSDAMGVWLEQHKHVESKEARSMIGACRCFPFPSIRGKKEGPFPVYPDRPYFDARFHEGNETSPGLPR